MYTTHYMEEVEQLCNRIAILDKGKIIAIGTKEDLKELTTIGEKITIELEKVSEDLIDKLKNIDNVTDNIILMNTYIRERVIQKVFYLKKDISINDITIQEDEVENIEWLSKEKINELIENNEFRTSNIEPYKFVVEHIK